MNNLILKATEIINIFCNLEFLEKSKINFQIDHIDTGVFLEAYLSKFDIYLYLSLRHLKSVYFLVLK